MTTLSEILENSNDMKTKWTNYVAFPYSRSYATALKGFTDTKGAQDKLNSQKADFGVLALSICSGGILTQVFAQTAWKAVAAKKALDVICDKNWEKAFKVADFVSNNKAANFIVGALWDTGAKLIDDKTKKLFDQNSSNFPSTQKWQTETDALTSLMGFVDDCYIKFRDTARSVYNNTSLNPSELADAVNKLTKSKFANPPSAAIVIETRVAMEIELLFHLQVVMDLDYMQDIRTSIKNDGVIKGAKHRIQTAPTAQDYPSTKITPKPAMSGGGFTGQELGYDDLGAAFYDKINSLHKSIFNTNLLNSKGFADIWNCTINKESFDAAYRAMGSLEQQGLSRVQKSLEG